MADRIIYFDIVKDGTKTSTNDLEITKNEFAVLESIDNIISNERKTRIFTQRDSGLSLERFLFEPIDLATALEIYEEIENGIGQQEPRARDLDIEITPLHEENTFKIEIQFNIDESERELVLETTLEKIR